MPHRATHIAGVAGIFYKAVTTLTVPKALSSGIVAAIMWLAPPVFTQFVIIGIFLAAGLDFLTGVRVSLKERKFIRSCLWNRIIDKMIAFGSLAIMSLYLHKFSSSFPTFNFNGFEISALGFLVDAGLIIVGMGVFVSLLENMAKLGVPFAAEIARRLRIYTKKYADQVFGESKPGQGDPAPPRY